MSERSEGALPLRPGPVGVVEAMRIVRVLTLIRAKARIQVIGRDVGIVMIWHGLQAGPLFLTLTSCYRTGHVI